jgi:hypothetical protein
MVNSLPPLEAILHADNNNNKRDAICDVVIAYCREQCDTKFVPAASKEECLFSIPIDDNDGLLRGGEVVCTALNSFFKDLPL